MQMNFINKYPFGFISIGERLRSNSMKFNGGTQVLFQDFVKFSEKGQCALDQGVEF